MKPDARQDEEESESPEHNGLMQRLGHAATERELRALDGAIGLFQRWRSRIGPPPEEDERRGGRQAPRDAAPAPAIDAGKHHRLRGFLIIVAMLLATGAAGMVFSYALLNRAIESDDLIIDDLRDQLAQMEKADARNIAIQAKEQNLIAEDRKTLREYQAKISDYEEQVSQLRGQVAALTPPPRRDAVATAGSRQMRSAQRPAPQKTGNCVANGSNAAADLSRCVERFNKP
jgi:hypothetical protein